MIDSPYKTIEGIQTMKALAKHLQGCCRDKDYAGSITFNQIIKFLEKQEETVNGSIYYWEEWQHLTGNEYEDSV